MVSIFDIFAFLLTLSALFGWFNLRYMKLPHTIGLLLMALAASLMLLTVHQLIPGLGIVTRLHDMINRIDFYDTIMNGMLSFLLFAGALQVDFHRLRAYQWTIAMMASVSVIISTVVVGFGLWGLALAAGFDIDLQWALVFGALISPTDPVAVLALLKTVEVPESIKAKIVGESLLNDGIAVVAFNVLLAVAIGTAGDGPDTLEPWRIPELFVVEAMGGALIGLCTGFVAHRLMRSINDHIVEVLISLGACAATYAICMRAGVSGPIAVVAAGIFIGTHGHGSAARRNHEFVHIFWQVVDELLNSLLFLLIGLEVMVITFAPTYGWLVAASVPVVLVARLISVSVPISLMSIGQSFVRGSIAVLTWGGLRGGVSVALALSLPDSDAKPVILAATYAVVVFSIVVQGLTVKWVIDRTVGISSG
jgi:CPA1 family monovalent cation:H+ antiporter